MKRIIPFFIAALLANPVSAASLKPLTIVAGQVRQIQPGDVLTLPAPTTANASINLPHGTAPTSPSDGDCWTTTAGMSCRINGVTVDHIGRAVAITNPALVGGLIGLSPDSLGSVTGLRETYTLSGSRTTPGIGHTIEINDGQSGPASTAISPTAASATYGQSVVITRPSWNTSSITGEIDGHNIFLRQSNGDVGGVLSNIGVRSGFAATLESITFSADSSGNPVRSVRTQLGVSNPRDGAYLGMSLLAEKGTDLTAGLYIASSQVTAGWTRYIDIYDASASSVFYIRGSDGAAFTKTVAPITDFSGDLGANTLHYNIAFLRGPKLAPLTYSSLNASFPCNSGNIGLIMRVSDASAAITTFNQIVSAGGGANTALVTCDGGNWRALSS